MQLYSSARILLTRLFWYIIIWIAAAFIFGTIRLWGIESLPAFERVLPFILTDFIIQMIIVGSVSGTIFGIMDFVLDTEWIREKSYWKIIVLKTLVQVAIAMISLYVLAVFTVNLKNLDMDITSFLVSSTAVIWVIYTLIISFFIYLVDVMKTKIGDRVLINLILGKYHNPRVESRVFMFLDMKDSTTHAEILGHIKFSSLIQDSLNDLTNAIMAHKVEVYQYVGDEAILTWNPSDAMESLNCLQVFYAFKDTLASKRSYYENQYGFVPFFKAGVHLGEVTVTEVGIIKREIAYHSDVLNTAARIQSKCNEFNAELLISEDLKNKIGDQKHFKFELIGGISLKGKQRPADIYKVGIA